MEKHKITNNIINIYRSILTASAEQYLCMFLIDLQEETIFNVKSNTNYKMTSNDTSLQQNIYKEIEKFISLENLPKMKSFIDIATLEQRLNEKNVISKMFLGKDHTWCNSKIIRVNSESTLRYIICIIEKVDEQVLLFEQKKKELKENQKLHSLLNAFLEEYNTVCNVNLETKSVEFSQLSVRLLSSYQNSVKNLNADELAEMYVNMAIHVNDQGDMRKILTKEYIEKNIEVGNSASFAYRNELGKFFEMRIFRNSQTNIFLGFKDKSHELEKIYNMIYTDSLTGVKNRKYFDEEISNNPCEAVIICDIDYFKIFNDSYGHQFGDTVISIVAQTLKSCLRTTDDVIRYGGDEFVIVFKEITPASLQLVLEKMRLAVESISLDKHQDIKLTMSFGAAYGNWTAYQILTKADEALYKSKKYRNSISIEVYEKGMSLSKIPNKNQ